MKKIILFFTFAFVATFIANAQRDIVGTPYTFNHNDISLAVDRIDLPAFDKEELMAEDAIRTKEGAPMRIGAMHHVSYNFNNSGRKDILPDGSTLWRLTLHSPGAVAMAVFFSTFNIPEGATMHIYSGDRKQLTGTYTVKDVESNGVMPSEFIGGDEVTIEYHEPADVPFRGD